jgi:hypothetical protein
MFRLFFSFRENAYQFAVAHTLSVPALRFSFIFLVVGDSSSISGPSDPVVVHSARCVSRARDAV